LALIVIGILRPNGFSVEDDMANNGSITGKVAIVTGAGRGLGRAMALGLARAGVNVIATAARRGDEIEEVAAASGSLSRGGRIIPVVADVTREAEAERTVGVALERLGVLTFW
jgi:NAD(P)-dependent dehydrogenase (short-subunit alcohol dehydrogenase family)